MSDFTKVSNFNKDANFQQVKFGADAPLLEVELNELQDIQTEARADIVRDSIPSGFISLSDLDYASMSTSPNTIKTLTGSIAYVNGYRITIPSGTIITLNAPPTSGTREDLVFLEVWKEEIDCNEVVTTGGKDGGVALNNNIKDNRVGVETSRRVQLRYRIKVADDIVFSTYPKGVNGAFVRGALASDSATKFSLLNTDAGVYKGTVAGASISGEVYAVPMFKVTRRNNAGYNSSTNANGSIDRVDGTTISDRPDGLFSNIISVYDTLRIKEEIYLGKDKDVLTPFMQAQFKYNKDFKEGIKNVSDEVGSVTLTNSLSYPFNNSKVSVALANQKNNTNYFVDIEPQSSFNIGDVIISEKQINGFKIEYTGSSASVIIKYFVRGGMFV